MSFHSETRMEKGLWKEWNVEGTLHISNQSDKIRKLPPTVSKKEKGCGTK